MRRPKIDDDALFEKLLVLFRRNGFVGTRLSDIARETGLQKASLYHRFPGGKVEMARVVLERAFGELEATVLAPLREPGEVLTRARRGLRGLEAFYHGGQAACLFETLSLGEDAGELRALIQRAVQACLDAFTALAKDAGLPSATAKRRAADAIVQIQGALVLARIQESPQVFRRLIRDLPDRLTKA
ncbi:MAG: TetR/AcrR family transcriptional regulator [Planctomycetota bacterium]